MCTALGARALTLVPHDQRLGVQRKLARVAAPTGGCSSGIASAAAAGACAITSLQHRVDALQALIKLLHQVVHTCRGCCEATA